MAHYRKQAAADRDALFGGLGNDSGGGKSKSKSKSKSSKAQANRDELFGNTTDAAAKKTNTNMNMRPTSTSTSTSSTASSSSDPMARLRSMKQKQHRRPVLQGEARAQKLATAEENRTKGTKCLQSGFFSKPDPVAASTFFKRAADAYQQMGDMPREERLFRLESAQCNTILQAWASVASDYTRAAELLLQQVYEDKIPDPTIADPALEASGYYQKAAEAWTQLGEKSKAAGAQVQAAIALNRGDKKARNLSKQALTVMEQAIEAHVPDVLNPFARYRQTGVSAYIDPDSDETIANPSSDTIALANTHIVTSSYAHEPMQELVYLLVAQYREYPTALYAAGAASTILERSGMATLSTSRAYLTETILLLATGDAVAAQQVFLQRHVQQTFYLTARECKLAEDLFRAVLDRDPEALEDARSPAGDNKAALANLHSSLQQLVKELRVAGVARKKIPETTTTKSTNPTKTKKKSSSSSKKKAASPPQETTAVTEETSLNDLMQMKTGYEDDVAQGAQLDSDALANELDGLDFGGLDDDDSDGGDDDDDDDFDLR